MPLATFSCPGPPCHKSHAIRPEFAWSTHPDEHRTCWRQPLGSVSIFRTPVFDAIARLILTVEFAPHAVRLVCGAVVACLLSKGCFPVLRAAGASGFGPVGALRAIADRFVRLSAHGEEAACAIAAFRDILKIPGEDRREDDNDSNELKAFHGVLLLLCLNNYAP